LKDNGAGHSSASDSDLTSLGPRSGQPNHGGGTSGNGNGSSNGSERSSGTQVAAGGGTKDIAGSRQSFKIAMGNPCEMFVDVM